MKILKQILFVGVFSCLFLQAEERDFFELAEKTQIALSQVSGQSLSLNNFQPCNTPQCLLFQDPNSSLQFFIHINSSEQTPLISFENEISRTLTLPSLSFLNPSSNEFSSELLRQFLVGHSWHPYYGNSSVMREVQTIALQAFYQALEQGSNSFLHISPTGTGKGLVLAKSLLHQVQSSDKKIFIVTAHQIQLVHQLFSEIEKEKVGLSKIQIINWSQAQSGGNTWQTLGARINQALESDETLILVITSQGLKARLNDFKTQDQRYGVYTKLIQNLGGVYIDEAHHLGAGRTKEAIIESLISDSRAFLYGATATPIHHQEELGEFFDKQHWSYLNREGNLFEVHPVEKVLEQLFLSINRGDITPFDDLYVVGENLFFKDPTEEQEEDQKQSSQSVRSSVQLEVLKDSHLEQEPVFIKGENQFYVLNPEYYERLNEILVPFFKDNLKGFIVTASIEEANRIQSFLSQRRSDIVFEAYHSGVDVDERRRILNRSRESTGRHYLVAVAALNEGVDLPHLSAYIDLNSNISIKETMHRIGRVLRIYPAKMTADIMFLINYKNEEMLETLLKVMELAEKISFKGVAKRKRIRRRGVDVQERGVDEYRVKREEVRERRKELADFIENFFRRQEGLRLEEIQRLTQEYIKEHPEFNLTRENFDQEKENIHPRMPSYQTIYHRYITANIGKGKDFQPWLTGKEPSLETEEIPRLVQEYIKEHPEFNFTEKNFDQERKKIHPRMPSYGVIYNRYIRANIGEGKNFKKWLAGKEPSLEEIPRLVQEYIKEHPEFNFTQRNFNQERKKIHPRMPSYLAIYQRYITANIGKRKDFYLWLSGKEPLLELEEIPRLVQEYMKEHPEFNFTEKNFDQERKKIHPRMPSYGTIYLRYIRANIGKGKDFQPWLLGKEPSLAEKEPPLELEEIPRLVQEYMKEHPEFNFTEKNFNQERKNIHPRIPSYQTIYQRYITANIGERKDFYSWLTGKESLLETEEIPKLVQKYIKEHPEFNLTRENFDQEKENIHPRMLSYQAIYLRYIRANIGKGEDFQPWLAGKELLLELEEIPRLVQEYMKEHPEFNFTRENFAQERKKIHPRMPSYKAIYERYIKANIGEGKDFQSWLLGKEPSLEEIPRWVQKYIKEHPEFNLTIENFDQEKENIHPRMPSYQTIYRRYITANIGERKDFQSWLSGKELLLELEEIPRWVQEYKKEHPEFNLTTENFNQEKENIHPRMPSYRAIYQRYIRANIEKGKDFQPWLLGKEPSLAEKAPPLELEEIPRLVQEYMKEHPEFNLTRENFDQEKENIHPRIPSYQTIYRRYIRANIGEGKDFQSWLSGECHRIVKSLSE